jgi:DNA-binding CsgD family transcriptional regulator
VCLLEEGLTQREIAGRLAISHKTVGTHLEHIFSKLGAHHRLQAVALAREQGLIGRH